MTSHPAAHPSPFAGDASTARRRLRRGAILAAAIAVLLSACGGGNGSTAGVGDPDAGAGSRALPADQGDASPGHCDGTIGSRTVDEVDVPSGATCTLEGTTVNGNVSVGVNGTLVARRVAVDGDVEGEGARLVEVSDNSTIGGNLQQEQGGSSAVRDSQIHGDLQWSEQSGWLAVQRTGVSGNLQADQNSGGLKISDNRIGGDLECEQNTPAPTGGDNTVSGHRSGQCAAAAGGREPAHRQVTPRSHPHPHPRHGHERPRCAGDSVSDDPSDDPQCDGGGDD
jgi:hypothetical protein